jgi:hypothetical protein
MFATVSNPQNQNAAQLFWSRVNQVANGLMEKGEKVIYITSEEDFLHGITGGAIFEANAKNAAERMVEKTHRLSTPEEIERFKSQKRQREMQCAVITDRQKQTTMLKQSPEQNQALADAVTAGVVAGLEQKRNKGGSN